MDNLTFNVSVQALALMATALLIGGIVAVWIRMGKP